MQNPKTSLAGLIGLVGLLLAGAGQMAPGRWGQYITMMGLGLSGAANALGNIASKDGGQ
jgi:hypothetical protein